MSKPVADFSLELDAKSRFGAQTVIVGIDEVGRGPWAGPVCAGAAIIRTEALSLLPAGLTDSKALTAKRRDALFDEIQNCDHIDYALGWASVEEIDEINILQATYLAMRRAVAGLSQKPDFALVDGNRIPTGLPCPADAVIKGDGKSLSIAISSIMAKVSRDRVMAELAEEFPHYGWESNAGYGVAKHREALDVWGVTQHHRKSFAPIRKILV